MLGLAIAYVATPLDLVPDFVPVVGQLDDVLVVALSLRYVVRAASRSTVEELWPGTAAGLRAVLAFA